jgi:uncharacterized cupredoxin-like copper-binding protein
LSPLTALAHGEATKGHAGAAPLSVEKTRFGETGHPKRVTRTVEVHMNDEMRFAPASIPVKKGETIRFRVRNDGRLPHEMVLGTDKDLKAHAEMMRRHPGMEHDEAWIAHVPPGQTGEIVWRFTRGGEFSFACLQPGHREAGMVGKLAVR